MSNDRTQIIERLAELTSSLDKREWKAFGEGFTETGSAFGIAGREAIVDNIRAHLGGCGPSQHLLSNFRVAIDADNATSLSYVRAHHKGAGELAHLTYELFGEYTDQWVRTIEGWRIESRTLDVTHDQGDPQILRAG